MSPVTPAQRIRPFGSDWVSVKLYCREDVHQEVLVGPLRLYLLSVMQQQPELITRWFFVRYHDLLPHLRLRLQCDPVLLCSSLLPSLLGWLHVLMAQGWISHFVFDSYEREIERYGGLEMIAWAEACFSVDSDFVLALLAFQHQQRAKSIVSSEGFTLGDLALLSVDVLLQGLGLDVQQRGDLYTKTTQAQTLSFPVQHAVKRFHGYQKRAQHLLGDMAWRLRQADGQQLEQLVEHVISQFVPLRVQIAQVPVEHRWLVLSSLIHMHCNRLLANREQEEEVMYDLSRLFDGFSRCIPPGIALV
jgi:thiopeptide-type bacteriocin biosynthesis protein